MENRKKLMSGFPTKIFTKIIAMAAITLSLVACQEGGSGGNSNVWVNGINNSGCPSCSSITRPLGLDRFQSQTVNGGALQLNMQLFVDGTFFQPGVSTSYNLYNGPAYFTGQMLAAGQLGGMSSMCIMNPGTYNIRTTAVAQMANAGTLMSDMELFAEGHGQRIYILLTRGGMLIKDPSTNAIRYTGNIYIRNINSVDCGYGFSTTLQ